MFDRSRSRLADYWAWLVGPWRRQNTRDELTVSMLARLNHLENRMSADRDFLHELAQDLSDLTGPVDALLASEAALRARVAELEGEAAADEAGDLAAAQPVREQLNLIAGKFAAKPDLPDVTAPAEPVVDEPAADEPAAEVPAVPADPAPAEPVAPAEPAPADPADPSDETPPAA